MYETDKRELLIGQLPFIWAVIFMHTAVASGRWCGGQWPQCGLSGHHESAH